MRITEQDIKNLTPEHRVVWHNPPGQPVEMGLYVDEDANKILCTDVGHIVRYPDGSVIPSVLLRIVRIIEPAFTPRRGMVIRHPAREQDHLVCFEPDKWLATTDVYAGWCSDDDARNLIENHGWKVVDDLTKESRDE